MKFCSHCGSADLKQQIPVDDHLPRMVCQSCETIHYLNPKIIIGCLIVNDRNEVMLCRRGIEPRLGFWNLPAGFLENNETVEDGALREVLEETGARVELLHLHSIYNVLKAQQVYLIFKARMLNNFYKLTTESTEIKFFPAEQIPWEDMAFSSNVHALEHWITVENGADPKLAIGTLELK